MVQWEIFRRRNTRAKLINIDIQPYGTTQAPNRGDIANVGGFSDAVFDFITAFTQTSSPLHWAEQIDAIPLPTA